MSVHLSSGRVPLRTAAAWPCAAGQAYCARHVRAASRVLQGSSNQGVPMRSDSEVRSGTRKNGVSEARERCFEHVGGALCTSEPIYKHRLSGGFVRYWGSSKDTSAHWGSSKDTSLGWPAWRSLSSRRRASSICSTPLRHAARPRSKKSEKSTGLTSMTSPTLMLSHLLD